MSKHQLCMSKGGTHPGEGRFGVHLCIFFFFFLKNHNRGFLVRLPISFLFQRIKFQKKDQTVLVG